MNKSGIEVHEFQKPRRSLAKNKRELREHNRQKFFCIDQPHIDDSEPVDAGYRKWMWSTALGIVGFWCAVIWWFA